MPEDQGDPSAVWLLHSAAHTSYQLEKSAACKAQKPEEKYGDFEAALRGPNWLKIDSFFPLSCFCVSTDVPWSYQGYTIIHPEFENVLNGQDT